MSHRILSRRYRPQRFDELFGQEHVVRMLGNALATGRVGQAYLFVGPRGVGKTTTARILARALNCQARVPAAGEGFGDTEAPAAGTAGAPEPAVPEPCGTCPSCRDIAAGSDLDVVEMDAASNNQVDDIRALREQVGYATVRSRYRIWIVDEVHMLSSSAFNAFLKTLEEPPPRVKFFFCTTELHKLPDTIVSRCTKVELRPIRDEALVARLEWLAGQEGLSLEAGLAAAIARAARGGLRDAESMLEQLMAASPGTTLTIADLDHLCGRAPAADVEALFAAVDAGDAGAALDAVGRSLSAGAQPGVLVDQWLDHLRSALADAARAGRPVARLAQSIEVVLGKRTHLRQGADGALVTEVTAIELARLPDARDVDALVAALAGRMEGARPREGATSPRASDDDADASGTSPARGEPPVASRPLHEGSKVREAAPAPRARPDPAPTAPAPRVAPRKDVVDDVVAAVTDLDDVAQRWPRLVEALAAREARLAAVLRRARPVALRGDVLELEVDGGTFEARTALIQSRAQAAFGQVAPRVLGRRVRPVVRAGASMAPVAVVDAAVRELPIVRRVAEFTGGHLVHVERQAPDSAEGHGSAEQASGDDPA
ncbi:MAG: DNA polymerase III subunit gamma/tau [Planctomycetes bacterium]|nr:DNA polymerase III subunit gamma/tau [Planctomycetota bacterium]MCB9829745.1 DNA polymerase III subunit gamma/tau [Planctomycetota bacterium]